MIGFLFSCFIYGALGALVSKTEDISKSVTPITMIQVLAFFVGIFGLQDSESMIVKICSFIPFSSSNAMLVRVCMGTVTIGEWIISLVILVISTILMGLFGAKIYRFGTLHYGNPLKLSHVIKNIVGKRKINDKKQSITR